MGIKSQHGLTVFQPFGALGAAAVPNLTTTATEKGAVEQLYIVSNEIRRARFWPSGAVNLTDRTNYNPEMLTPAANTAGAWIRCSYWLAVACQIVYARNKKANKDLSWQLYDLSLTAFKIASSLLAASFANFLTFGYTAEPYNAAIDDHDINQQSLYGGGSRLSDDPHDIQAVFDSVASVMRKAGLSDISLLLLKLGSVQRDDSAPQGGPAVLPGLPAIPGSKGWWGKQTTKTKIIVVAGSTVVTLAILAPYIRAVSDVASITRRRRSR